jgi:hypothetical protein
MMIIHKFEVWVTICEGEQVNNSGERNMLVIKTAQLSLQNVLINSYSIHCVSRRGLGRQGCRNRICVMRQKPASIPLVGSNDGGTYSKSMSWAHSGELGGLAGT